MQVAFIHWIIKVEEAARGLGLDAIGLDRDVAALSGGQRTKVLISKAIIRTASSTFIR